MKKILYVGNKLNKANTNVSYISILGNLLSRESYEMYYASSYSNKIIRLLHMIFKVIKLRSKVNTILIDTYSTTNFYYAYMVSQLCRVLKLDYIPILHGGNLPARLKTSPKMSGKIFNNAKVNVAPSGYIESAFRKEGYTNVIHIPNTLEIENYQFSKREYSTPNLLWVRSFSKIYNPELAIDVLNHLKQDYHDAKLCMVGPDSDGSMNPLKLKAKELEINVKFTGKLDKKEWVALSRNYNVFINTANFDNMPLSVVEAMAVGLPVVSTNVGGMPFLIKHMHEGILVKPDNAEEMANALRTLFKDEDLRSAITKNARSKVEGYDWKAIKSKWISLLS